MANKNKWVVPVAVGTAVTTLAVAVATIVGSGKPDSNAPKSFADMTDADKTEFVQDSVQKINDGNSTAVLRDIATRYDPQEAEAKLSKRLVVPGPNNTSNLEAQDPYSALAAVIAAKNNVGFEVPKDCTKDDSNVVLQLRVQNENGGFNQINASGAHCKSMAAKLLVLENQIKQENPGSNVDAKAEATQVHLQTLFDVMKPTAFGELPGLKDWQIGKTDQKVTYQRLAALAKAITKENIRLGADPSITVSPAALISAVNSYIHDSDPTNGIKFAPDEKGNPVVHSNTLFNIILLDSDKPITPQQLDLPGNKVFAEPLTAALIEAKNNYGAALEKKLEAKNITAEKILGSPQAQAMTGEALQRVQRTTSTLDKRAPMSAQDSRMLVCDRPEVPFKPQTPPVTTFPPDTTIPPFTTIPPGEDFPPFLITPPSVDFPPTFTIPPTTGGGPGTPGGGFPGVPSTGGGGLTPRFDLPLVTFGGGTPKKPGYIFEAPPLDTTPIDILNPPIDKPPTDVRAVPFKDSPLAPVLAGGAMWLLSKRKGAKIKTPSPGNGPQ